jgi:hypothetical protein
LVSKVLGFVDLVNGGVQIKASGSNLGLELILFSFQLFNSLFVFDHGFIFLSSQLVDSVNNLSSELLELVNDLLEKSLV